MANSQQRITLTATPVQITNGSNYAFIQSANGHEFSVAAGDTMPAINNAWQQVKELGIAPPYSVWARSQTGYPMDIKIMSAG
ncbi:hypothetical protein P255_01428 [Acinetobacter brisouii CIP 110357]|uniref:Uncharacterized protein n=1 Tax=Acinetobacter brisouii CIP 110357 TaxID=1341683 RepID=V2VT67_9GAMM|nr:hypothetical protein [Acinetobacter brisouii]ENV46046.1 hypothetical protein F954_02872 [Acinetobacter brisouii ANC 4119]ESK50929.1 hypothetical protein P255_01428 [Acinetobacter brisouii CIP 110357]